MGQAARRKQGNTEFPSRNVKRRESPDVDRTIYTTLCPPEAEWTRLEGQNQNGQEWRASANMTVNVRSPQIGRLSLQIR